LEPLIGSDRNAFQSEKLKIAWGRLW